MKNLKLFNYLVVIISILLFVYILFSPKGVSDKAFNHYCKNQEVFFKMEIINGTISNIFIDKDNHGVREITILDSLGNTYQVDVIGTLDWEQVELLKVNDRIDKEANSFLLILPSEKSVNILKYCNEYFYGEKN